MVGISLNEAFLRLLASVLRGRYYNYYDAMDKTGSCLASLLAGLSRARRRPS